MASYPVLFAISKFNGKNYLMWFRRMQILLTTSGFWDIVSKSFTLPTLGSLSIEVTANQQKDKVELEMKIKFALEFIYGNLEEEIHPRLPSGITTKQAWDILKTTYEGSTSVILQTTRRNFENLRMFASKSINDFVTRIQDLMNQMQALR